MEHALAKLLRTVRPKPGTLQLVTVRHDAGCPTLTTDSMLDCTCSPEFTTKEA